MLGYHVLEQLSWIDAFLNASMILGGMGPVNTLATSGGKLFAGFYALYSGLVVIMVAAGAFVAWAYVKSIDKQIETKASTVDSRTVDVLDTPAPTHTPGAPFWMVLMGSDIRAEELRARSDTLIMAHVDDHPADSENPSVSASATTESVPIGAVHTVALTHVVSGPERHRPGATPAELTLAIGWGGVQRIDLEPATCGDPACEADHGFTGSMTPDDVVVRVSVEAEGRDAVRQAVAFARALSAATAR